MTQTQFKHTELGPIPEHWEVRKLKYVLQLRKKIVGVDAKQYDLLSLTLKGVIKRDMENPTGKFPTTFDSYQEVNENDFIFCNFDNEETPRAVGLSPYRGMITGAYDVLHRIDAQCNDRFLLYYFLWIDDVKRFKPLYKGLRKTIPLDSFLSYKLPIPPLSEQQAIVAYLDEQTGKIDQAIEREQKMIDLLNERKQIIIQQAVTKGLHNDTSNWKIQRLGTLGTFSKGGNISRDNLDDEGSKNAILYGDIYTKYFVRVTDVKNHISESTANGSVRIQNGDILMTGSGETKEDIGKTVIFKGEEAYIGGDVILFRQKDNNGEFISYALNSQYAKDYRYRCSKGEIIVHIYPYALKNMRISLPPNIEEQQKIVTYLDAKMEAIDRAIEAREKLIFLLQERKQIIINEVVTGKIKVS